MDNIPFEIQHIIITSTYNRTASLLATASVQSHRSSNFRDGRTAMRHWGTTFKPQGHAHTRNLQSNALLPLLQLFLKNRFLKYLG